ncbi:MAG: polysaccharide ABC transporter ATP-binding protein [Candidatus Sulfotelmatobacter sp.]
MSDVAIRCEGLAKRYEIGEREAYKTIRDVITDAVAAPFRRLRSAAQHSSDGNGSHDKPTIWALKDVSFEIKRGEVVGIIGRNGAGKSTLLKILSRITEPTEGRVEIWGRVGSLLEVGTGFHPELTGRDNIFLNGAILGMKKTEIARKFDEIVAFAEVEKFIDTPVKRYSSGMYVRLAFAVAAHMETEILLVDEVLAVGDTQFQKKCLGKMGDVAKHGRTVLFVSHTMASVQTLCERAVLLNRGLVETDGRVDAVVSSYLSGQVPELVTATSPEGVHILNATASWTEDKGIHLEVGFSSPFELRPPMLGLVLSDELGRPVFGSNPRFDRQGTKPDAMGFGTVAVDVDTAALRPGFYTLSVWLGDQNRDYCTVEDAVLVEIGGEADSSQPPLRSIGSVKLPSVWNYRVGEPACELR